MVLLVLSCWPVFSQAKEDLQTNIENTPNQTSTHIPFMIHLYISRNNTFFMNNTQMGKASRIMRRSIFTYLQNIQLFSSTPIFFALPFAVAALISQSLISSSYIFPLLHARLSALFVAAGFPPSSELFAILTLKLSQTILSFLFILPFTLSFLLIAKASIIRILQNHKQEEEENTFFSWCSIFTPLCITQLCTSLVILSANSTCFCLLVICFNIFEFSGLTSPLPQLLISTAGAVFYSVVIANAFITCNLSLIISGIEKHAGFDSILKAYLLIRSRNTTALSLTVSMNMGLASIEALFQYRVVRTFQRALSADSALVLEGIFIAYLYAMLLVLETITSFEFLKRCKQDHQIDDEDADYHRIEIVVQEKDESALGKVKIFGVGAVNSSHSFQTKQ